MSSMEVLWWGLFSSRACGKPSLDATVLWLHTVVPRSKHLVKMCCGRKYFPQGGQSWMFIQMWSMLLPYGLEGIRMYREISFFNLTWKVKSNISRFRISLHLKTTFLQPTFLAHPPGGVPPRRVMVLSCILYYELFTQRTNDDWSNNCLCASEVRVVAYAAVKHDTSKFAWWKERNQHVPVTGTYTILQESLILKQEQKRRNKKVKYAKCCIVIAHHLRVCMFFSFVFF